MRRTSLLASALLLIPGLLCAQSSPLFDPNAFQDVLQSGPNASFFTWIQLAKRLGLAVPSSIGPCVATAPVGSSTPLQPPPGSGTASSGCAYFGPDAIVSRAEMAYWVVKAQMDEPQISYFLCATGGDPSGLSAGCGGGTLASSFGDLGAGGASIVNPFVGVSNAQLMRYIEVMVRRGYTQGCTSTIDPIYRYCPNDPVTRAQMSVFIIRAKMNNVFPTTLSGTPQTNPYGDNFSATKTPYFTDVTPGDPVYGPYFIYVQKMRDLGITSGTTPTTFSPGNNLTRKEIATFVVRAFFL